MPKMTINGATTCRQPCAACPWRAQNHGKRHPGSFYTKRNLRRLWNQIRGGGGVQSCHPTDPGHPDHQQFAGAKDGGKVQECEGSVILVTRELRRVAEISGHGSKAGEIDGPGIDAYLKIYPRGLKRNGILYYLLVRPTPAPIGEGNPLPLVPVDMLDSEAFGRYE